SMTIWACRSTGFPPDFGLSFDPPVDPDAEIVVDHLEPLGREADLIGLLLQFTDLEVRCSVFLHGGGGPFGIFVDGPDVVHPLIIPPAGIPPPVELMRPLPENRRD